MNMRRDLRPPFNAGVSMKWLVLCYPSWSHRFHVKSLNAWGLETRALVYCFPVLKESLSIGPNWPPLGYTKSKSSPSLQLQANSLRFQVGACWGNQLLKVLTCCAVWSPAHRSNSSKFRCGFPCLSIPVARQGKCHLHLPCPPALDGIQNRGDT